MQSVEDFRLQLNTFLSEHHPGKGPKGEREKLAWAKAWNATLVDHGFAGPAWPKAYGGLELPFSHQLVYSEAIGKARVPSIPGTGAGIFGPTVIKYGTDEQRQRWLLPMLRGDVIWAQGYSEPGAGSDLQALRTQAVRDGNGYRVTGQKIWSTQANLADMLFALVRTGPQEARHKAITYLAIDLHQPGVTVQPIRDMAGGTAFCEIFLDGAWAPETDRLGPENGGWDLVRNSLGHERAAGALSQAGFYRRIMDELLTLARERGIPPLWRRRLAALDIRIRIMSLNALRTIDTILTTGEAGSAASFSRLYNSELEQELHELAVDLLGPFGALGKDPRAVQRGRWVQGMLATRASTIGAGTAEIQRNTIAERVLGLPFDPPQETT